MGLYCMEPEIIQHIPKGVPFGFDNLMHQMLDKSLPVYAYKHEGCWMDIGRHEDFSSSEEFLLEHGSKILGT
jgi:mannose-1-phosphate guanylyltransferase